jgi:hypothetical protein
MATVTKDFRIKSGLVVEGANGTINSSDIITEDKITGGTQSGISVSYSGGNVNFDVNDPTITIDGDVDGSATMTDLGNTTISVTLDTVNSNVGTFGSGTEVPSITVDGKGRVTAVTTNSVATDLSIAGDGSSSDTVSLLSDTLTFTGGDGATMAVTDNTVTTSVDTGNGLTISNGDVVIDTAVTVDVNSAQTLSNKTLGTDLAAGGFTISGLADPVNAQDAATKVYVDSAVSGLNWKEAVNLLADSNVALTGTTNTLVIDSHAALDVNDDGVYRLLLIGQTTDSENGIYDYNDDGSNYTLTRSADADTYQELDGAAVFVKEGTLYGATSWVQSDHYMTDFSGQDWSQFSGQGTYLAGNGLTLTGNEFSIDDSVVVTETDLSTAVTNLTDYVDGFLDPSTGTTVEYIDDQDAATLAAANGYTDALVASGDATATPTYLALDVNSVATQVAAEVDAPTSGTPVVAYAFAKADFRTAKFLVKVAYGTHTEVSEVLLTLDTSDNIAITEYAVVSTNGSSSSITAGINGTDVELQVTPTNNSSTVTVMGTLLI